VLPTRSRLRLAEAILAVGVLAGVLAPIAKAGDTWVLDRARTNVAPVPLSATDGPGIVQLTGSGTQTRLTLTCGPPDTPPCGDQAGEPKLPLTAPVGIDVDERNDTLLVTDSGGYSGTIPGFSNCMGGNGCGALLRVNPATGVVQVVAGPDEPGNHELEDPYDVLIRPELNDALVADQGTTRIIRVDLATHAQTVFNVVPPPAAPGENNYPGGLRSPWGLARDPRNGDILVVNAGNPAPPPNCTGSNAPGPNGFCQHEFSIPVPPECNAVSGYILRLSSTGVQKQLYCNPLFSGSGSASPFVKTGGPRNAVVDASGDIFVVDPNVYANATHLSLGDSSGYGAVLEIDPTTGLVDPVTAGGSMATGSGIDFSYAGSRLVLADETLFPYGQGGCGEGCGGVIQVNPDGGAQATLAARAPNGWWIDPIDLAVDHDGGGPPDLAPVTVPEFLQLQRDEGKPTVETRGVSLPVFPLQNGSVISVYCVSKSCRGKRRQSLVRRISVPPGRTRMTLSIGISQKGKPFAGATKRCRKCALKWASQHIISVTRHGANGRFYELGIAPGGAPVTVRRSGCLRPGQTSPIPAPPKKKRSATTSSKRKKKKTKKRKRVSPVIACPTAG